MKIEPVLDTGASSYKPTCLANRSTPTLRGTNPGNICPSAQIDPHVAPFSLPVLSSGSRKMILSQDRKASDSPCSSLLDPKNPPVEFHAAGCRCLQQSHKRNSELDIGTQWGRNSTKHECASFAYITTGSFSVVLIAVCVLPSEKDRGPHRVAHFLPGWPLRAAHDSVPAVSLRASRQRSTR